MLATAEGTEMPIVTMLLKWTFRDILFVPVQGASQNIRSHILAALRLLPHRLAGMLRAITLL